MAKTISTSVSTGDILNINGQSVKVGTCRNFDGKNKIALHYIIDATSASTEFVTTHQLNKLLKKFPQ